ncbi:alpha/beta hydrolase [Dokdonia ponticola]|uniref:Alpha/beta hydrolase n=1 Tax=Dokdonia ponticola TaxID=2041041 RepID=A0ABV9I1N4_9FLAO
MKLSILTLLVCLLTHSISSQTSLKDIDLKNGKYTVGFTHYTTIDSTRSYISKPDINAIPSFRPIPVSIWYPSTIHSKNRSPLSVLNYMEILKEEEEWEHLPNYFLLDWFYFKNTPENQQHLTEITTAFKDLSPAKGAFPVVIYAPGFEFSSIENFALCELLASHGYIVIASPSRGATSKRYQKPERAIETQARDLEFLIKEISDFPSADMKHVGTMGYSFGGISNILLQMRNPIIKANLSLDGTIRYNPDLLKSTAFYDLKKANIPFMHLAQKEIPKAIMEQENMPNALNTDFTFYDELTESDAYKIRLHDLSHTYFSTLGVLFAGRDPKQDKSDEQIMASYKIAATYGLQFMNAYLKNEQASLEFIRNTPQENKISTDLISIELKKAATKKAFEFYDFLKLAKQQAYKNMLTLYKDQKRKHPALIIPEGNLNTLGLQLIFNPITSKEGIAVYEFATMLYPNSANLYDSLAEGYVYLEDTKNAIRYFEKSLSLDPTNQNAIQRLKELRPY